MVDANKKTNDHSLPALSYTMDDSELKEFARELEYLLGGSTMMRYPDRIPHSQYPKIPNDVYSAQVALKALDLARKIVDRVRERIT